jgi:hypothetical protein
MVFIIVPDKSSYTILQSWAGSLKTIEGENLFLSKNDIDQTTEQQRRFNEWPIIELHEEVDSIQTIL